MKFERVPKEKFTLRPQTRHHSPADHRRLADTSDRLFSVNAQEYLECLRWREPQLEALLRQAGFSAQVAVDAVQNALFVAYQVIAARKVEQLGERRWPWLIRVALNKGRDIHRTRWHGWIPLVEHACAIHPFAEKERPAHLAAVDAAFDRLPPDLKELVAFCYMEDHSYSEAVERFKISLGVVSRRLQNASDIMRSELCSFLECSARAAASS
ncbi:MAG TPA: sigma factor-like helix-turn-helix DNA-binding protein [Bryobacteraceae bacterium]|jgi:DNA-directed RNA polymerase specialized sigma24 family protein